MQLFKRQGEASSEMLFCLCTATKPRRSPKHTYAYVEINILKPYIIAKDHTRRATPFAVEGTPHRAASPPAPFSANSYSETVIYFRNTTSVQPESRSAPARPPKMTAAAPCSDIEDDAGLIATCKRRGKGWEHAVDYMCAER
jgi:hypothetical protein